MPESAMHRRIARCGPDNQPINAITRDNRTYRRDRAGLRVGTAITEGTSGFLVNRRMNKSNHQDVVFVVRGPLCSLSAALRPTAVDTAQASGFAHKARLGALGTQRTDPGSG